MDDSYQSAKMLSRADIEENGRPWHRAALQEIESRLADRTFPCVFSRNAFRKQLLRFVFVEACTSEGIRHLAAGLTEYVELSRDWNGTLDTSYPLVAAFAPDAVAGHSVADYHAFGWRVLQELHGIDPAPWPDDVATHPGSAAWSMCFNGMPLFCNMSTPAHRVRRSRNLGQNFVLVINPRERFDVFAGDTPSGRKVRANIRGRVDRYDRAPHSPQLGSYGGHALEWTQYGLIEENTERADVCPFHFRKAASAEK